MPVTSPSRGSRAWCHRKKSPGQIDTTAEQPLQKMRDECPAATGPVGGEGATAHHHPLQPVMKFMVSVNLVVDYGGILRYAVLMKGQAERVFQRCGL